MSWHHHGHHGHHGHHHPHYPPPPVVVPVPVPAPYVPPASYPPAGIPLPYQIPISGGMYPGRQVTVTGVARSGPFEINLRCGPYEGGEIGLHFNPRPHEHAIVRNSFISGGWGHEERHGHYPFAHGGGFTVQIICEPTQFKVLINGTYYADFYHRLQPTTRIDYVQVKGDVTLNSCSA